MTIEELQVVIKAQKQQFDSSMTAVKKELKGVQKQVGDSISSIKGMGGASQSAGSTMALAFGKIGVAIAAVVASLTAVVKGINSCIEAASKLEEVQNVVNTAFPTMSSYIDSFAQSAMKAYGLTERMAKQYASTFGAMAQGFNFTEQQAYTMGTTLTGLAGDVSSFYNISQDSAMTKLQSIFTGETESLKQLGIVMTETNLNSFAMSQGISKNVSNMTEQEKVAIRYQFVLSKLSMAQGDFARTSGSWANQVRLLQGQFEELKTNLGAVFIQALTPVMQVLSKFVGMLVTASKYVKAFFEMLFGKKEDTTNVTEPLTEGLSSGNGTSSNISKNLSNAAKSADKIKKTFKSLAGFDEINNIASSSSSSSGSSVTGNAGGISLGDLGLDNDTATETVGVIDKIKEHIQGFLDWFSTTFGPYLDPVKEKYTLLWESIKSITQTFVTWFMQIWNAIEPWLTPIIQGIMITIGGLTDIFRGVIDFLNGVFTGDWSKAWEGIKTIFTGFGEAIIGAVGTVGAVIMAAFSGAWELVKNVWNMCLPFFRPIWNGIVAIFSVCKNVLSGFFSAAWEAIKLVWGGVTDWFKRLWNNIKSVFSVVKSVLSGFFSGALTAIKTTWSGAKSFFSGIWTGIKNVFANVGTWFKNSFSSALTNIKNVFNPITKWFKSVWDGLKNIASNTWDGILKIFQKGGKIFDGITDGIAGIFKTIVNGLITGINKVISAPFKVINGLLNDIRSVSVLGIEPFSGLWSKNPLPVPQIPKLAKGGIVDSATLAVVGEAGKEAVMPLENNTGWITELAQKISDRGGNGSGNDRPVNIVFKIGQTEFGKISADSLNRLMRQEGEFVLDTSYL